MPETSGQPPELPPRFHFASDEPRRPAKRFFWIRTWVRGPWIAAEAAYSDPHMGFYVPGGTGVVMAHTIGDEIVPPDSARPTQLS